MCFCRLLRLLLHHDVGGKVEWAFQDGGTRGCSNRMNSRRGHAVGRLFPFNGLPWAQSLWLSSPLSPPHTHTYTQETNSLSNRRAPPPHGTGARSWKGKCGLDRQFFQSASRAAVEDAASHATPPTLTVPHPHHPRPPSPSSPSCPCTQGHRPGPRPLPVLVAVLHAAPPPFQSK